jgi:hypothetical protein
MLVTIHNSAKRALLGFMLLLAGMAGVVTVEVDNDGDMETPAVVIETPMDAPVEQGAFAAGVDLKLQSGPAESTRPEPKREQAVMGEVEALPAPALTAFPLVIPLRT